jgi:hypothetical protein
VKAQVNSGLRVSWTTGWALSERHQRRRQDLIICLRSCLVDSPGLFLPGMSWLGGLLDSILAFGRTRKPLNRPSNALTASLYSIVLLKEFTHQQRITSRDRQSVANRDAVRLR